MAQEDAVDRTFKFASIPGCAYCPFGAVEDGIDEGGYLSRSDPPHITSPEWTQYVICKHPAGGSAQYAIIDRASGNRPIDIKAPAWCPLPAATFQFDTLLAYLDEEIKEQTGVILGLPKKRTLNRARLEGRVAQMDVLRHVVEAARRCFLQVMMEVVKGDESEAYD